MPKTKKKEFVKNLVLLLAVLIIFLLILEGIFRVSGLGELNDETEFSFIKHSTYNPFLIFGPNVNMDFTQENGDIVHWNSQGFRLNDDLPLEKKSSEYRVFAFGGSSTENLGNDMNVHYPGEAGKLLNSDAWFSKEINIVNSGKSAYSTAHTLIRLQFDILPFKPDMITVMHNVNDLTVNFFPYEDSRNNYANKYFHEFYANTFDIKDTFIRKIRVVSFAYITLNNIRDKIFADKVKTESGEKITSTMRFTKDPIELKASETFRNNLVAIAEIGKAHGITVVFMSQPAIFTDDKIALAWGHKSYNKHILYPEKKQFKKLFEEYNAIIEDVAEQEGVYFIDMYTLFGHEDQYFIDSFHYSYEGILRFSEIYSKELRKIIEAEGKG